MGIEVADDEAATVKKQYDGGPSTVPGRSWRPIDPDADGTRGTWDGPVLDPQFGMQRTARQVAEPLPRRIDTIVG